MKLVVLFSLLFLASANDTLILVHVIFRHGDRTPADASEYYPNDPYVDDDYYPLGRGHLTDVGKLRCYNLGKELRRRYGDLLGPVWTPEVLFSQSSDHPRTKMSLQLVLASLFPPAQPEWLARLGWQPIPFSSAPMAHDEVLFGLFCPRFARLVERMKFSLPESYEGFVDYISEHTGGKYTNASDVSFLYTVLAQEEECGRELPEWTRAVYPEPLRSVALEAHEEINATPEMRRVLTGGLLRKIINDTAAKIEGKRARERKMCLYAAHDMTVSGLLKNLGVYWPHFSVYASYIALELHEIDGVRGIRVYYQDYEKKRPRLMTVPGCDEFCPFDKFKVLVDEGVMREGECF